MKTLPTDWLSGVFHYISKEMVFIDKLMIYPSLQLKPITYRQACEFIRLHHRHHDPPQGCKFCVGAFVGEAMAACAVCGRPVSRELDNGEVCEITRLCSDGTPNACSFLYGLAAGSRKPWGISELLLIRSSLKTVLPCGRAILFARALREERNGQAFVIVGRIFLPK